MAPAVVTAVVDACSDLGIEPHLMPSGGGHDAQEAALYTDAGMIFVPSKHGISHAPEEFTSLPEICRGVEVLAHAVAGLAGRLDPSEGLDR